MATIANNASLEKPSVSGNRLKRQLPTIILFYSLLLPQELAFFIGDLRFDAYRFLLIILLPATLYNFVAKKIKLQLADFLILTSAFWITLSFIVLYGFGKGLESGGRQSVDILLAYFFGRAAISDWDDVKTLLIYFLPGFAFSALFLALESVSGQLIVRRIVQNIVGLNNVDPAGYRAQFRLGVLRGYSVFIHPIVAGIFVASHIVPYFLMFKKPLFKLGGSSLGLLAIFSMSSAAIIAMFLNITALIGDRMLKQVRDFNWVHVLALLFLLAVAIHLLSQNGIIPAFYRYFTLNPATGHFRTLTWQYGLEEVWRNPWFGIGLEEYERPYWVFTGSIDAHFLFLAVRSGIISALAYFLTALIAIIGLAKAATDKRLASERDYYFAYAIVLSLLILTMFSVTFPGATLAWFNFTLGMSITLVQNSRKKSLRLLRQNKGMAR